MGRVCNSFPTSSPKDSQCHYSWELEGKFWISNKVFFFDGSRKKYNLKHTYLSHNLKKTWFIFIKHTFCEWTMMVDTPWTMMVDPKWMIMVDWPWMMMARPPNRVIHVFPIRFGFTIEIKPPFSWWWMMMARPPHIVIHIYFTFCLLIWFELIIEILFFSPDGGWWGSRPPHS